MNTLLIVIILIYNVNGLILNSIQEKSLNTKSFKFVFFTLLMLNFGVLKAPSQAISLFLDTTLQTKFFWSWYVKRERLDKYTREEIVRGLDEATRNIEISTIIEKISLYFIMKARKTLVEYKEPTKHKSSKN